MNVTKSIVQVEQKRRIRISKNAIFTNGIFLFNIKSQNVKTITYKTENSAGKAVSVEEITSLVNGKRETRA